MYMKFRLQGLRQRAEQLAREFPATSAKHHDAGVEGAAGDFRDRDLRSLASEDVQEHCSIELCAQQVTCSTTSTAGEAEQRIQAVGHKPGR
jgi:hypothetical protein